jgi:hypothetical protein
VRYEHVFVYDVRMAMDTTGRHLGRKHRTHGVSRIGGLTGLTSLPGGSDNEAGLVAGAGVVTGPGTTVVGADAVAPVVALADGRARAERPRAAPGAMAPVLAASVTGVAAPVALAVSDPVATELGRLAVALWSAGEEVALLRARPAVSPLRSPA